METVRRGLAPVLTGRRLERVEIMDGRLTGVEEPGMIAMELEGDRVMGVGRRGKYLLLVLESGRTLVVHLRMTGWFQHLPGDPEEPPRHLRARFGLDDGTVVLYSDQRRFGTMRLVEPGSLDEHLRRRAGPEPLDPAWTPAVLRAALRGRRAPIKALLLDQLVVAGVGNIYADEALWEARVHPLRPGGAVTAAQARRLHGAVVEVLRRGIDAQGASIRNYRGVDGASGSMQERFNAYGREGLPCRRCGYPIRKTRVAQRGTYYCPHCTRAPRGVYR